MNTNISRRLSYASALIRFLSRWSFFVENEIAALDSVVEPGGVCIDAGASYGSYTYALAGRAASVHSVEPMPASVRGLSFFRRLLNATTVHVHRAALSDTTGTARMSQPRRYGIFSVNTRSFLTAGAHDPGANAEFSGERLVQTPVVTIDKIRADAGIVRISFVKADVEGNELAVLRGARDTLERDHPAVMLEIEQRHLDKYGVRAESIVDFMAALGYRMHVLERRAWRPADRVTTAHRNYLFV
jgi:FkbM family methyltransferase